MDMKEMLVKNVQWSLEDLSKRAARLSEMDAHSLRTFSSLLQQANKEAIMLSAIVDYEVELARKCNG